MKKKIAIAAVSATVASVVIGGITLLNTTTPDTSTAAEQHQQIQKLDPLPWDECATKPHFNGNDPGKAGEYDFGIGLDLSAVAVDLHITNAQVAAHNERCEDPVLLVGHEVEYGITNIADEVARVQHLLDNRDDWRSAVKALEALEQGAIKTEVGEVEGPYWSLYQKPSPDGDAPKLGQDPLVEGQRSTVLRYTFGPGKLPPSGRSVTELRLECLFQPIRQEKFSNVTPVKEVTFETPPSGTTPPIPPVTTTTPPPGKTPTCPPGNQIPSCAPKLGPQGPVAGGAVPSQVQGTQPAATKTATSPTAGSPAPSYVPPASTATTTTRPPVTQPTQAPPPSSTATKPYEPPCPPGSPDPACG